MIHSLLQTSQCCEECEQVGGEVAGERRFERAVRRGRPRRLADDRRPAVVQEVHRQVGDLLALIAEGQPARVDERPRSVASTPSRRQSSSSAGQFVGRHGQDHPLLGLGDPDLGVRQALVLERGSVELDLGAELGAHLADGRAEAAGAAIGDGVVQAPVAGLDDHVEHLLLGDRVADLHGAAGDALALRRSARPS